MRQRRSGVRSETTAAWLTLENIACSHAAIYPILRADFAGESRVIGRSHPGFVSRGPVNRGYLPVGHPQVDGELPAVMHLVHEHEPQQAHLADVTHLLRRDIGRASCRE